MPAVPEKGRQRCQKLPQSTGFSGMLRTPHDIVDVLMRSGDFTGCATSILSHPYSLLILSSISSVLLRVFAAASRQYPVARPPPVPDPHPDPDPRRAIFSWMVQQEQLMLVPLLMQDFQSQVSITL